LISIYLINAVDGGFNSRRRRGIMRNTKIKISTFHYLYKYIVSQLKSKNREKETLVYRKEWVYLSCFKTLSTDPKNESEGLKMYSSENIYSAIIERSGCGNIPVKGIISV